MRQYDAVDPAPSGSLASLDSTSPRIAAIPGLSSAVFQRLMELYEKARVPSSRSLMHNLVDALKVTIDCSPAELGRIPKSGPVVVVANHPFGILDGAVLGALLLEVRPDVKIVTNFLLTGVPELEQYCIFVDPFGTRTSASFNRSGLKKSIEWLRDGGLLVMFPAGEVAHWQVRQKRVADPDWNANAARLVKRTGANVVPVFFEGSNSLPFHLMGMVHPKLRTMRLPHELLNKTGSKVALRIGSAMPASTLETLPDDRSATRYLRWRTELLGERGRTVQAPKLPVSLVQPRKPEEIVPPVPKTILVEEYESLGPEALLDESREYQVVAVQWEDCPSLMREVGRLREVTFRAVGEGTGAPLDLDRFDRYYTHLLLWHRQKQEVVGGYRLVDLRKTIRGQGPQGLYTNTLFHFDPTLFEALGPAIELGRSFVRPEYQRQYGPLLMLWKGIAAYVAAHPDAPVLFGAVSISGAYSRLSRELLVKFLERSHESSCLSQFVRPRCVFRSKLVSRQELSLLEHFNSMEELSPAIEDIERDGKGVPILLRQYLKLGGKLLGFNLDKEFSDALDGLIVIDLRDTDPTILERYMGKTALQRFRAHHGC